MAARPTYSYGEPNWDTVGRWLHLGPAQDGPVWMLNLMKYRPVAAYDDERHATVSGREADDAYAPVGPLAAVGAMVALFGDVVDQPAGEPTWDRVAIVRYPTRLAFFEMQERDDFKKKYVHKEAGMEFSIVMGCLPVLPLPGPGPTETSGPLVMRVRRLSGVGPRWSEPTGFVPVATFDVDGVVLGDGRNWDDVRFDRLGRADLAEAVAADGVDEQVVAVIEPSIDRLVESVETAEGTG